MSPNLQFRFLLAITALQSLFRNSRKLFHNLTKISVKAQTCKSPPLHIRVNKRHKHAIFNIRVFSGPFVGWCVIGRSVVGLLFPFTGLCWSFRVKDRWFPGCRFRLDFITAINILFVLDEIKINRLSGSHFLKIKNCATQPPPRWGEAFILKGLRLSYRLRRSKLMSSVRWICITRKKSHLKRLKFHQVSKSKKQSSISRVNNRSLRIPPIIPTPLSFCSQKQKKNKKRKRYHPNSAKQKYLRLFNVT